MHGERGNARGAAAAGGRAPTGRPRPLPERGGREGGREHERDGGAAPSPARLPPSEGGVRRLRARPPPRAADVRAPAGPHRGRGARSGRAAPPGAGCASLPAGGCGRRRRRRKVRRRHGGRAAAEVTGAGRGGCQGSRGEQRNFGVFCSSELSPRRGHSSVAVCPRRLCAEPSQVAAGLQGEETDTGLCCVFGVGSGILPNGDGLARVPPSPHLRWDAHVGQPGCAGADSSGDTPGDDRGGLGDSGSLSKPLHG